MKYYIYCTDYNTYYTGPDTKSPWSTCRKKYINNLFLIRYYLKDIRIDVGVRSTKFIIKHV